MTERESLLGKMQVEAMDKYLREKWGVVLAPDTSDEWEAITLSKVGEAKYRRLGELNAGRQPNTVIDPEVDKAFYSLTAQKPFGAWIHSPRRALILDATALVQGLIETLGPSAEVLEVGCGAGYSAAWLAKNHDGNILGIDFSEETLQAGREKLTHFKNIVLKHHDILSGDLGQQFDLIYSIDGLPASGTKSAECFAWCGRHLRPGGMLVVTGIHCENLCLKDAREKMQPVLDAAALGLSFIEPVGGWIGGDGGWASAMALVFKKGSREPLPEDLRQQMDLIWSGFASYANVPTRRKEQKTVAYYLASRAGK